MTRRAKKTCTFCVAALIVSAAAVEAHGPPPTGPEGMGQASELDDAASMLPSKALMDDLLRRWTHEVAGLYGLPERQRDRATEEVQRRWSAFFEENRRTIEPLLSDYLRWLLLPESSDEKGVSEWARRAAPLVSSLREHTDGGIEALRDILEPEQRERFERQVSEFRRELDAAEGRLRRLEAGEFEARELPELLRMPLDDIAAAERRTSGRRPDAVSTRRKDRVDIELDAWRVYVESFIVTHDLDPGQRDAAGSLLSELSKRASTHREGRRSEIEALERRIEKFSGSEEEWAELERRLVALYGPIDAMFRDLKTRLHKMLTAEQRARMERAPREESQDND